MTAPACRHVTLAKNAAAHVQRCVSCGCISIHLGHVTVRVDAAGLEALWAVLGDAALALQVESALTLSQAPRGVA